MGWALLAVMLTSTHAAPAYKVGPAPEWVETVALPSTLTLNANAVMLLDDVQIRAGAGARQRYEHRAWKVLALDGVKELARQQFVWEPSYSTLTLHGLWIWRDGSKRSAWSAEDARVLDLETGLDQGIYDGRRTLVVELRDLRVGDVIEYATTITGDNPVFEGRVSFSHFLGTTEPLALMRLRVLWDGARPLQVKTYGGAEAPAITTTGKLTTFRLEKRDLKPVHFEGFVPFDVPQVPWVTFTDWRDWADVAQWSARTFKTDPPAMRFSAQLERFRKLPEDQRLEAVVRFVQDDVRYVGVELGAHSHRPHSVEWVLERGFGDCKDKSQLLVAFLRALGFDAAPMLVNSDRGELVRDSLSSPNAFDHVIVKLVLPDGPRFIDATQTHRRGKVAKLAAPAFGKGLVIDAKTTALEELPVTRPDAPTWELQQTWTEGQGATLSTLQIVVTGRGEEAAALRRIALTDELKDRRRKLREDEFDVELELVDLAVSDDEAADVFSVTESYRVKRFWLAGQHEFRSAMLARQLMQTEEDRTLPLALDYPRRAKEVLIWHASQKLSGFDLEPVRITLPAFEFQSRKSIQSSGKQLIIEWEFQNLRDRVEAEELTEFRKANERALHGMAFDVFQVQVSGGDGRGNSIQREPQTTESKIAILLFCLAVVVLGVFIMNIPKIPGWWKDGKAKWRVRKFAEGQKSSPGEVASHAATVSTLDEGRALFTSSACPRRHAWGEIVKGEGVRLGEDRISVLTRRCTTCEAREDRYLKLTSPS